MNTTENRRLAAEATILAYSTDSVLIAKMAQQVELPVPVTLSERIEVCRVWLAQ